MTRSRKHIFRLTILIAALTATFLLTHFLQRYVEIGQELLTNHDFSSNLEAWKTRPAGTGAINLESGNILHLSSEDTDNFISIWQDLPPQPVDSLLKLSAYIKVQDVVQGPKGWHKARLILDRRDSSGKGQKLPHHAASLDGTAGWKLYEEVFRMAPDTAKMSVKAELARSSGNMWVRKPGLKQVSISPLFTAIRPLVFILWAFVLAWMFHPYFTGKPGVIASTATLLVLSAILAGTLAPAVSKTQLQGTGKEVLISIGSKIDMIGKNLEEPGEEHPYDVYIKRTEIGKIGHFLLFGVFSFLLFTCGKTIPVATILADAGILAGTTELLQFFTEGRTPKLYDFGIDLGGILTGLLIFFLLFRNKRRSNWQLELPADI
ncbi:MAG: VanZ family protein [Proteobacteria bacterium]|nr:VanZ family protein [Pseudomonadota bacterium]MBU1738790.1 VanZ family protein [Pseudomonadota bacterium]